MFYTFSCVRAGLPYTHRNANPPPPYEINKDVFTPIEGGKDMHSVPWHFAEFHKKSTIGLTVWGH